MTHRTLKAKGRRRFAEPVHRPEPDQSRLVDLVLHLADVQHHAATRPHTGSTKVSGTPIENDAARSPANGGEPKEQ